MRINPRRRSSNLEDRRGASPGGGMRMGGGGFGGGRMGLGGLVIVLILSAIFGQDFLGLLGGGGGGGTARAPSSNAAPVSDAREEPLVLFVSAVLDSTQSMWRRVLPTTMGAQYRDARLVLFRGATQTACGYGQSASGPFYCPPDERVFIDLDFFQELHDRFQAPGDFAQAYVLAHEIGHHVQNVLGTSGQVQRAQQQDRRVANELSIRLELQADCYAGVWGATAARQGILDPGDLEEGLAAAAAVGDDRIQKSSTGRVSPESWTHGSSAQRMEWFRRGLQGGDPRQCDTFGR